MRKFRLRPLAVACAIACLLPYVARAQAQGSGLDFEPWRSGVDEQDPPERGALDFLADFLARAVSGDEHPALSDGGDNAVPGAAGSATRRPATSHESPAVLAAATTRAAREEVQPAAAQPAVASPEADPAPLVAQATGGDGSGPSDPAASPRNPVADPLRPPSEDPAAGDDARDEAEPAAPREENRGRGLRLEREPWPLAAEAADVPTYVIADEIEGVASDEIEARGNAELRKPNAYLKADRIRYFESTDEVEATGNVRLYKDGDLVTGPRLRMRVDQPLGVFEGTEFTLAPRERSGYAKPVEGRGTAAAVRLDGEDRYRVTRGRFTTCKPTETGWSVGAEELDIDFNRSVVTARDARFTFLGLTTPPFPYATFSLNNERKSGFLPPLFGFQGKTGTELALPFYWNIAPNQDATLTARYMQKRGLQGIASYRYLGDWYSGIVRGDYLPNDRILEQDRWAVAWRHAFNYRNQLFGYVNYNQVSDDNYFRDLSGRLAIATQTYLPREGAVTWVGAPWWSVTTRAQDFQTLQNQTNPVPIPYTRLPQVIGNALYQTNLGVDAGLLADFTNFTHPSLPNGRRTIAYPYLTWPLLTPGTFVVPKVGVNATYYDLSDVAPGIDTRQSRVLPIASVDSGLIFERDTALAGRPVTQTLEPRLYYLWIPYKDQSTIPLFDTSIADFNYAQIFSENYYLGWDRISNANQITAAVTSRIIIPSTGQEVIRALIGQRYYFTPQLVQLNPRTPLRTGSTSPILLAASGLVYPKWYTDVAAQLAPNNLQAERLNVGIRYQPALNKVLNFGYRYTSSQIVVPAIHQVGVSGQWPLGAGFYGVGRFNYDIEGRKPAEMLGGIEYNAGCWIVRVVGQSFPTSSISRTNAVFLQFEFDGFAKFGSNPLEALRRNIPGYTRLNTTGDPNRASFDYFD